MDQDKIEAQAKELDELRRAEGDIILKGTVKDKTKNDPPPDGGSGVTGKREGRQRQGQWQ